MRSATDPLSRALVLGLLASWVDVHAAQQREAALAQCADCHPSQAAGFAATGMARALGPLAPEEVAELARLAPLREEPTGFTYAFEGGPEGARLVEGFATAGGGSPWRDPAPIAFAVGAGELDRSYVVRRFERFWFGPLEAVGPAGARHAALAPGHTLAPGTRFTQPVTPECLGCHTDTPPPRSWPLNLAPSAWKPRGISCGGCHGALVEHVRVRSAELAGEKSPAADPLLVEKEQNRVQRLERCAACHLQGDARIELDPQRLGPPPPGTPLLATRAVFVAREPGEGIGFVSQVERLLLSRCALESRDFARGGLACESCHDPHRSLALPEERARVRGACHACHELAGSSTPEPKHAADCALPAAKRPAGQDCVDCHMRRTGVFDVAEVVIHDHWIRRRPGAPSARAPLRFPESPAGDWRLFAWPEGAQPAGADDPGLWTMAYAHGGHGEKALEFLARGPGTRALALPMLHHVRAGLLEQQGALAQARAAYERALALDPELAESSTNLGPLLARLGDPRAGKAVLDRLLQHHPLADTALRNRAAVRLALNDGAGAIADLGQALALAPDAALAQALAKLCLQLGDGPGAQRYGAAAHHIDPRVP